jgi:urease accessory protein
MATTALLHMGMGRVMSMATNMAIWVMRTQPTQSLMCTGPIASMNKRHRQSNLQQANASPSRSAQPLLNRMCMAPVADMSTETAPSALLQLIWLASPALPIGGFSYSEGLEAAIEQGLVNNEQSATDWVVDQLHLTQSRGDMAVMAQAIPAWQRMDTPRLQALNDWVMATRESAEMRLQAEQMGRSLLDWLRNLQQASETQLQCCAQLPPTYPLAMALALSLAQAPLGQALQAVAFGWAENLTQAALKAVPLGQSAGQRMLARLAREIPQAVQTAMDLPDEDRQAFSPMLAILSSRHETQYSRIFRS